MYIIYTSYWFYFSGKPWPIWCQIGNFYFQPLKTGESHPSGSEACGNPYSHSYPEVPRKISFWSWVVGTPHSITISSALPGEECRAQALLQCCSRFKHRQAAAASPGREFWSAPCPGPTELESLGWGPACCVLADSPLDSYTQKLEKH